MGFYVKRDQRVSTSAQLWRLVALVFATVISLVAAGCSYGPSAARPNSADASIALAIASDLTAGRFSTARADFDRDLQAALPTPKLANDWHVAINASGAIVPFKHAGRPIFKSIRGYGTYFVPLAFSIGGMEVQVTFDASGQVGGLFLRPAGFDSKV